MLLRTLMWTFWTFSAAFCALYFLFENSPLSWCFVSTVCGWWRDCNPKQRTSFARSINRLCKYKYTTPKDRVVTPPRSIYPPLPSVRRNRKREREGYNSASRTSLQFLFDHLLLWQREIIQLHELQFNFSLTIYFFFFEREGERENSAPVPKPVIASLWPL